MRKLFNYIVALSAAVLVTACGETGKNPTGPGLVSEDFGISFDRNVIKADGQDAVNFKIYYKGEDVTASAQLYRVTGSVVDEQLESMAFKTTTPGQYSFWASYPAKNQTSATVTISATDLDIPAAITEGEGTSFKRRAFFHQHTGADCKFCPYMVKFLRGAINDEIEDKVVLAGIRNYSGEAGFASIPNPAGSWPYLQVDYTTSYSYDTPENLLRDAVKKITAEGASVGISVNPVYYAEKNQIICRVAVKAAVSGEYNVGLWLMQDNYYAVQQFNNPTEFDKSYHTHHNCVRVAESKYLGAHVGFPLGYIPAGETREWVFMMGVRDNWWTEAYEPVNLSDLHLAAFVTEPYVTEGGKVAYRVANVVDTPYNTPKPFDFLK